MDCPAHQIVLSSYTVDDGPYMRQTFDALVDLDYDADRSATVLKTDFTEYLNRYYTGWKLLCRVQTHPSRYRDGPRYKVVDHILAMDTDADAITVQAHLTKHDPYPFDFRFSRAPWRCP